MLTLYLGVDVSKGYADMECMEEGAGLLAGGGRFDDTPEGHRAVLEWITSMVSNRKDVGVVVGLESSGGLERNWLQFFRKLKGRFNATTYHLNPLAVKRFLSQDLHRCVTDKLSARGIAMYLRQGMRLTEVPFDAQSEGAVTLYRHTRNIIRQLGKLKNELQSLLPRVHPDLVAFCRLSIPAWLPKLLIKYPTVQALGRARPSSVAKVPYVTLSRAQSLVSKARESVAAQRDPHTATTIRVMCEELLHFEKRIEELKKYLCDTLKEDDGFRIIKSIPGIGDWSAVCLRYEIAAVQRFPGGSSLVAYAGLDPRVHQSGDSEHHLGISHRGRKEIRAILYPCARVAVRQNPVIKKFFDRLEGKGKPYNVCVTACMRKMLHIIYGCWITGVEFDPAYDEDTERQQPAAFSSRSARPEQPVHRTSCSLSAPISRREAAKRKRAAAMPQTRSTRKKRGPGAATASDDKPPELQVAT